MELSQAVRRRRMVRAYDPDRPVPRAVVDELLELALRAPSAGHTQGWAFLVLDDITSREAFWSATTGPNDQGSWLSRVRTAPVLIICYSDKSAYLDRYAEPDKGNREKDEALWPVPYWDVDTGMAAMIALLAATDRELGACFFGVPAEHWTALQDAFAVPAGLRPIGVISLGYPAPDKRSPSLARGRRPWSDVVRYGSFGAAPG